MNALGMKLHDYRDVMSDSQTSAVSERSLSHHFLCLCFQLIIMNILITSPS